MGEWLTGFVGAGFPVGDGGGGALGQEAQDEGGCDGGEVHSESNSED